MELSPITLFVYNRLEHAQKTVEALQKNALAKESELFIFLDGAKNEGAKSGVQEVREYIKTIYGFKNVTTKESAVNMGLANSIISGVTEIVNKYGKVIVLEDDLVTSPYFLKYMNEALDTYEKYDEVISIHGYMYPTTAINPISGTSFIRGADCWGWATWKRGWDLFEKDGQKLLDQLENQKLTYEFNFEDSYLYTEMLKKQIAGKNSSWAIRWYASAFLKNKFTVYPNSSLVKNIGMDGSGRHSGKTDKYDSFIFQKPINLEKPDKISESIETRKEIIKYFNSLKPNFFERILNKIKKYA